MKWSISLFATTIFVASCCGGRKVDCAMNIGPQVLLRGYGAEDLDTVIVKKYEPGSNLAILTDSIARTYADSSVVQSITLGGIHDYVIEIPATKQSISFTNTIYRPYICGECRTLFDHDPGVRGQEIESVEINGVRTENLVYELTRP